jgi:NAD-dependent dihydropyrimidine dehydrogenase PreA subunit
MVSSALKILEQKPVNRKAKKLKAGVKPQHVTLGGGKGPHQVQFNDSAASPGSCIRCPDSPCIEYSPKELTITKLSQFPADKNSRVCPTDAITWPVGNDSPVVNPDLCISCGLCMNRCPVAAIHFDDEGIAQVNDIPNSHFILTNEPVSPPEVEKIVSAFKGVKISGAYLGESDSLFKKITERFTNLLPKQAGQFPNLLVRNLLLASGLAAAMRRLGDTNIRMDMVFENSDGQSGTAEIEMGAGVVDAPRNILDNVAVLHSRYAQPKEGLTSLIVCRSLPNLRSEFWAVLTDINSGFKIKVNTLSLWALYLVLWNRKKLNLMNDSYFIDSKIPTLRGAIEKLLGRKVNIPAGLLGILESAK